MTNNEKSVMFFSCCFGFFISYTGITIDKVFNEACKKNDSKMYFNLRRMFMKDFGY